MLIQVHAQCLIYGSECVLIQVDEQLMIQMCLLFLPYLFLLGLTPFKDDVSKKYEMKTIYLK